MNKGTVTIINYNKNAHAIVAAAGKISTTEGNADEIYNGTYGDAVEKNIKLINKIISSGHESVLEHISLNLSFNNVSVFVEQFMIEFRLASFTVKSRRYVDFGAMGYVVPDLEEKSDILELYKAHMKYLFDEYNDFIQCGIPKEDARFVLPYSFRSNFYCTVNAREFIKIVNEMVYGRGKNFTELVLLGQSLQKQCEEILPYLNVKKHHAESSLAELFKVSEGSGKALSSTELVTIINGTEEPEKIICQAAALHCGVQSLSDAELEDKEKQEAVIREILKMQRRRELEQVHYTIRFEKISLAGITHLVRHRMQSILIPDYLMTYDFEKYVLPESIMNAGLTERYMRIFAESQKILSRMESMGLNPYDKVYLLLSGMTLPVMTTMNANELLTFIRLRACNRAQWEIKECADALLQELRKRHPVLFSMYGPTCFVTGECPEGRMTCGKKESVCEMYR